MGQRPYIKKAPAKIMAGAFNCKDARSIHEAKITKAFGQEPAITVADRYNQISRAVCAAGLLTHGSTPSGAFPLRWSGAVAALGHAGKLAIYSGGPVPESHRLPYSPRWITFGPSGHHTLFCFRWKINTARPKGQVSAGWSSSFPRRRESRARLLPASAPIGLLGTCDLLGTGLCQRAGVVGSFKIC